MLPQSMSDHQGTREPTSIEASRMYRDGEMTVH